MIPLAPALGLLDKPAKSAGRPPSPRPKQRLPGPPAGAAWMHPPQWLAEAEAGAQRRPTEAQKRGLRYEARVLAHLRLLAKAWGLNSRLKPWVRYRLSGDWRLRWAQPDFVLEGESFALVVEVKRIYRPGAEAELEGLYAPLVRSLLPTRPVLGLLAFQAMAGPAPGPLLTCPADLREWLLTAPSGTLASYHWLGR